MRNIKIIGAGSIGNHLTNAARSMQWDVDLFDKDDEALKRTKNEIYPLRYKKWDDKINLINIKDDRKQKYDVIFVGTPPDSHIKIAISEIKSLPKLLCIEKPLCEPSMKGLKKLMHLSKSLNVPIWVGYDHVVGDASNFALKKLKEKSFKDVEYIDVEIREHWEGIFKAHHWLKGPEDSYLGNYKQGGGACSEHSHGINLWQFFSHILGGGKVVEVNSNMVYEKKGKLNYDKVCFLDFVTSNGLNGRVIQDVVTKPPSKNLKVIGKGFKLEWYCNFKPNIDAVSWHENNKTFWKYFKKTRADDFINEMKHIDKFLKNKFLSPLDIERAIETMEVISAAHTSNLKKKSISLYD